MSKSVKILCLILVCVISVISLTSCASKNEKTEADASANNQTEAYSEEYETTEADNSTDKQSETASENIEKPTEAVTEVASNKTESTSEASEKKASKPANELATSKKETPVAKTEATTVSEKKGTLYRADCNSKIWAGVLGACYMEFKNIDTPNEWGENGKVYELYVTYVKTGEEYSMWSDGHWSLDEGGNKLTLTPVNQSENGNIGVAAGQSKTFTGKNGFFEIPVIFEQGGKTVLTLKVK